MPKEIELEEEAPVKNKGGRPRKTDADMIFGDEIDSSEERRLAEETEIQNMLQREDANSTTIIISRRMNSAQKFAHLTEIGIRDYSREDVASQYGGGQYRCRVRRSDGQFGHTWYFDIDMSRKADGDAALGGTPTGVDAVRLVETMAERFGKKDDQSPLVSTLMSKSDEMMKMMIMQQQENTRMMISMMTAILGKPAPQPDSAMAQMSTMLLKHSLDQSHNRMEDVLNTMTKLKKLTDNDVDDRDEEEGSGSFLKDVMSAIPQIMKQVFQPQQAQQLPPAGVSAPMPAPVQEAVAPAPGEMSQTEKIGMVVAGILQQCEADVPPVDVYKAWAPLISEEDNKLLKDYLAKPEWFENLLMHFPMVADKRDWLVSFRDIVLNESVEVEADEEASNRLNGARRVKKHKSKKG